MHRFPFTPSIHDRLQLRVAGFLSIFTVLVGGCTTPASSRLEAPMTNPESVVEESAPELIPVVQYGRYTLVELTPRMAQHNLLLQVVDVSIPATQHATVGDGLRYVLQRSGYSLCEGDSEVAALYELPLPAAHLQLGPMFLRDALLTLAGPAWELQVDDRARQVCFTPNLEARP
jgi:type IV pili sensor histidine kinase/response regulator